MTNGKSVFDGQKRALLCLTVRQKTLFDQVEAHAPSKPPVEFGETQKRPPPAVDPATARTVNELARQRFKQRLLGDILVDLMICEIEGWCKLEYIRDLRKLINSIAI